MDLEFSDWLQCQYVHSPDPGKRKGRYLERLPFLFTWNYFAGDCDPQTLGISVLSIFALVVKHGLKEPN